MDEQVTGHDSPPLLGLSTQLRRSPRALISLALFTLLLLGYPLAIEQAVKWIGVRGVGAAVLVFSVLSSALMRGRPSPFPSVGGFAKATLICLLALAMATGDPVHLRLIVAVVYVALASIFLRSLRDEGSLIETLVRSLEPAVPGFIRPYCRKTTALWSAFFFVNAVILAVLAVRGPLSTWTLYSGRILYAEMGVIFVVDFFVRKTWFRYYFHTGPFDRAWSFLFPAENTAAGRRSAEYIRRMKER